MKNFNAGVFKQQLDYKSFNPSLINRDFAILDKEIYLLLEVTVSAISELRAATNLTPNVDGFIKMHIIKEATYSSRIEGTRTSIDEALLPERKVVEESRDDWEEVQNYIKALNLGAERIREMPFSIRLLNEIHAKLLEGVRGENKTPGEIRRSQNWIGGVDIKRAKFVPPYHEDLPELLSDWEKFWHNKEIKVPVLIKIAIMHYQFETIHPYSDGNGRLGRLLMILQLIESGFLDKPILYISNYLERYRGTYYDLIQKVRDENSLEEWIKFMLKAFKESAEESIDVLKQLSELREDYRKQLQDLSSSKRVEYGRKLLEYMLKEPIISVREVEKILEVSYPTANSLIKELVKLKILTQATEGEVDRLFCLQSYVDIFKG
ncbi:MAG TPA: Fic family protein [bacterium]|nr:Fic family protein [bacterium]